MALADKLSAEFQNQLGAVTGDADSSFFYKERRISMVAETITYTDYNGEERTETHYFNLSKAELLEMQVGTVGTLSDMIARIVSAKDVPALSKVFKELILKSYGVKSPDGRRFIKSEELSTEFSQTEAYSTLYVELATDAKKAAKFFNEMLPKDLLEQISKDENLQKFMAEPTASK